MGPDLPAVEAIVRAKLVVQHESGADGRAAVRLSGDCKKLVDLQ
jgi:hypothetical protein